MRTPEMENDLVNLSHLREVARQLRLEVEHLRRQVRTLQQAHYQAQLDAAQKIADGLNAADKAGGVA